MILEMPTFYRHSSEWLVMGDPLLNAKYELSTLPVLFPILREVEITCLRSQAFALWTPALQCSFFFTLGEAWAWHIWKGSVQLRLGIYYSQYICTAEKDIHPSLGVYLQGEFSWATLNMFVNLPEVPLPHLWSGNNSTYFTGLLY